MITNSTTIESLLVDNLISVRTYNCLGFNGLHTIGDIIDYIGSIKNIWKLLSIRNLGKKSLTEIQSLLLLLKEEKQISFMEEESNVKPINDFVNKYNELIKEEIFKLSIENYYEKSKASLSVRSIHVLEQNFNTILEIVSLHFTGLDIKNLEKCGRKTNEELTKFIANLYSYISSLFIENSEAAEISLLKNSYPFLLEYEIKFVMDFKKRMSHLPMLYILYYYLIRSNSRFEKIFCRYHGIGRDSEDLKEISMSLDLSFERCRQILKRKALKHESLIASRDWRSYIFLKDVLFYNDYNYKTLLEEEGLPYLTMSAFIGLCSLVSNIQTVQVGRNTDKKYYISDTFYKVFDFKNCIKDIESTLNKKCTENTNLPISVFIDSYWLDEPTFEISKVEDIIIYILKEDYGIVIGEDKTLTIQRNALDRSEEVYKIIEEYGNPMHVKQIRAELISRYPELSNLTIEQVRVYTLRHPHICALGKTSKYTIDKWEFYTGTIRDLLYDILSNEKDPMLIEDIYDKISLIYPKTNIKSITSSMISDELQRFVRFVGSYYGVVNKKYDDEFVVWDSEAYSRKNFDERIKEFETFLKSHHHLPRYDWEKEEEAALCRWYKRATASDASITFEQQKKLTDLLSKYADYLITATEYSFYRYCDDFKVFIENNMEFPTLETDPAKYSWFKKNMKVYENFEDKRKVYFEELIEFLYTYGFEI